MGETLVAFPLVLGFHFIIRGFIPSGCIMGVLFFIFFISILYSFICLTISLLYFMHLVLLWHSITGLLDKFSIGSTKPEMLLDSGQGVGLCGKIMR